MNRLKELRTEHNRTQKEMAEMLGIDRTTYSKYESGASEPNIEMLSKLADFFSVSLDYLVGNSEIKTALVLQDTSAEDGPNVKRLKKLFTELTEEQQAELLRYGEYISQHNQS